MLEAAAIHLMPTVGMPVTGAQPGGPTATAQEFDAVLIEAMLRHGGLFQPLDSTDGGGQSIWSEWFTPLLAQQLAEQLQLGLGEMMMQSISDKPERERDD